MGRLSLDQATRLFVFCVFGLAAITLIAAPAYQIGILTLMGIEAIATLGLTLLLICGLVSLGHAAYMGIGAYSAALVAIELDFAPPLAILFCIVVTALISLLVGVVTLRLKGIFLPLATLAVGVAVPAMIVAWEPITGGASGLSKIPEFSVPLGGVIEDEKSFALLVWLLLCLLTYGFARAMNSRMGRAIAAVASNKDLAAVFGINVFKVQMMIVGLSGALAGLAGGLYAFHFNFLSTAPFNLSASIHILIAAVIGGSAHPFGAIIGVVVVTLLETVLQNTIARGLGYSGAVELIFFGILLVAVLIRWPGGLWSIIAPYWPTLDVKSSAARSLQSAQGAVPRVETTIESIPILKLSGVEKNFGGLKALSNVSLELSSGEMVGLIGPNGAGKSTTFNLICGLTKVTNGRIAVMGRAPDESLTDLASLGVSRTFQHVKVVPGLTVLENIALGVHASSGTGFLSAFLGLDRVEEGEILSKAMNAATRADLAEFSNRKASELAMGQLRLLEVARALAVKPRIVMLDEPAAGLRAGEKRKLSSLLRGLKAEGIAVLLVEHDMDFVMNTVDRIYVLDRGRNLASGTPAQIKANPDVVSAYLGAS